MFQRTPISDHTRERNVEQLYIEQARQQSLDKEGDIESKERTGGDKYALKDEASTGTAAFQRREKIEELLHKERELLPYYAQGL